MVYNSHASPEGENLAAACAVLLISLALAVASARDTSSWNDSSRLATIESVVDYHTLAIDQSVFLNRAGSDKMFIDGHFYSDKSPVPVLFLAMVYQGWQWATGLTAATSPRAFIWRMALSSSGLAYVIAVWCVFRLTRILRLALPDRLVLTACFALATVALPYTRQMNNHIQLLAVAAALFLGLANLARTARCGPSWGRLLGLGALSGLGYSIDLAAGPALLACVGLLVVYRCQIRGAAWFALGTAPCLALHHAVNYAIGGTLGPASTVPDYFHYPGCIFRPEDLTGAWHHPSFEHFLGYATGLVVGSKGFLSHNLPLFLAIPGLVALLWRRVSEGPELLAGAAWSAGTWLAYATASNNYSGLCFTIRWLVPLLVPGFFVLALLVREFPRVRAGLVGLTLWGALLTALMWPGAVWLRSEVRHFWLIQKGALLTCFGWLACEAGLRLFAYFRRQAKAENAKRRAVVAPGVSVNWIGARFSRKVDQLPD
jgi:hypothetical protein